MGVGFVKKLVLSRECKREEVMDEQSSESEEEEVMGEAIGESEMEELVQEWGWQRGYDKYDTTRYDIFTCAQKLWAE